MESYISEFGEIGGSLIILMKQREGAVKSFNKLLVNDVSKLKHQSGSDPSTYRHAIIRKEVVDIYEIFLVGYCGRSFPSNPLVAVLKEDDESLKMELLDVLGDKIMMSDIDTSPNVMFLSPATLLATKRSSDPALTDYGFYFDKIPMYYDSKAAIAISYNPVQHSHTKHIDGRYHFIKEKVEKGIIELFFVRTEYQLVDLFTKALSEDRFKYLVRRLGMRCMSLEELEVLENESA
nr:ribonuclease H [Tanacetum cinerariifolium]